VQNAGVAAKLLTPSRINIREGIQTLPREGQEVSLERGGYKKTVKKPYKSKKKYAESQLLLRGASRIREKNTTVLEDHHYKLLRRRKSVTGEAGRKGEKSSSSDCYHAAKDTCKKKKTQMKDLRERKKAVGRTAPGKTHLNGSAEKELVRGKRNGLGGSSAVRKEARRESEETRLSTLGRVHSS